MILFYIWGIVATVNGAILPLTDLLPPDFPDSAASETETSARLKGLYVPDNIEKLYDDGSDKSPPAPVPLAHSPYGPVPAGSGLEGQYVADNLEKRYDPGLYVADNIEKQFDDGLDRNEHTPEPIFVQSRFGLVPAGSGIEGQYADDKIEKQFDSGQYIDGQLEKRFDDGLYRGEPSVTIASNGVPHGLVPAGVGSIPSK